jgi:hypothetical protein
LRFFDDTFWQEFLLKSCVCNKELLIFNKYFDFNLALFYADVYINNSFNGDKIMGPFSIVREIPNIIYQDGAYIYHICKNPIEGPLTEPDVIQQKRVQSIRIGLIVTRALVLIMTLFALSRGLRLSAIIRVLIGHEMFVLSYNATRIIDLRQQTPDSSLLQGIITIWLNVNTTISGVHPLAEGTVFTSFWNSMINRMIQSVQDQQVQQ